MSPPDDPTPLSGWPYQSCGREPRSTHLSGIQAHAVRLCRLPVHSSPLTTPTQRRGQTGTDPTYKTRENDCHSWLFFPPGLGTRENSEKGNIVHFACRLLPRGP